VLEARELVAATVARITGADDGCAAAAQADMDRKTKPRGSLGSLEVIASRVAGIRANSAPGPAPSVVIVAAADHGIAAENVSAYPQEVTAQMVRNFAAEGAAVNVLARRAGARVVVVDAGVVGDLGDIPGIVDRRIGAGTANATRGPAMTQDQAFRALAAGIEFVELWADEGVGLIGLGEMGIANTTSAAAITAALLPVDPAVVCGRGTGVDDAGLVRKIEAVRRALAANAGAVEVREPVGVLAAVGGFEIGILSGVALGAAARRVPVLLDGFITAAAALVAARISPACVDSMLASHRSTEPGHDRVLDALELDPILDLQMRLGEGSGAALAIPIVNVSLGLLNEMATFDDANVTDAGA
jgi:nicotinate-nucleotide--dimethylbenzimidazole phosphoribosyltransferase